MNHSVPAILAVPGGEEDRDFLSNLSRELGWELRLAHTYQEVVTAMRAQRTGVVLSEARFSDGHGWKDVLNEIRHLESPPMLIVTDRLADERLWSEVLNMGGYDLLLKPFDPEEVLRVVYSAWSSWRLDQGKIQHAAA